MISAGKAGSKMPFALLTVWHVSHNSTLNCGAMITFMVSFTRRKSTLPVLEIPDATYTRTEKVALLAKLSQLKNNE